MATFRIMTWHINGARDRQGCSDLVANAAVIKANKPDLVLLQEIGSTYAYKQLVALAAQLGLDSYGGEIGGRCAFLSRYPIKHLRTVALGFGDCCIRADLHCDGQIVHLFNLTLSLDPLQRKEQIHELFSDQLLTNPSLPCPAIIAGDFGLPLWGRSMFEINNHLKRSRYPLWRATYPAVCPFWGRDRVYFRGAIKALAGNVVMSDEARRASMHLPMLLTVETSDTSCAIRVRMSNSVSSKHADAVCG